MIFHHDCGRQDRSKDFRRQRTALGIVQSRGRLGSWHDNCPAESFWASLKRKLGSRLRVGNRAPARHGITAWIKYDNATRLRRSLGKRPPIESERRYRLKALQAG